MSKKHVEAKFDIREPPELTAALDDHPEVDAVIPEKLPAADIEIGGIGFERKTMSDYASSMLEGRLREQVVKLNQRYEHAYVLVEGDLLETDNPLGAVTSNISPTALRGSMASLTARHGVSVLCCSNLALLADMAVRLARKHIEEKGDIYIPSGAMGSNAPTAKMMYACIDGVGADTAETLYDAYPSISGLVKNATPDELEELDGIGPTTAEKIMEGLL